MDRFTIEAKAPRKTESGCLIKAYDGKIYVGTGDDRGYLKGWWAYDIAENTWTQLLDFAGNARYMAKGKMITDLFQDEILSLEKDIDTLKEVIDDLRDELGKSE